MITLLITISSSIDDIGGSMEGSIDQKEKSGTELTLYNQYVNNLIFKDTTDSLNHYSFYNIVPGTYTLNITKKGYVPMSLWDIEIRDGYKLRFDTQIYPWLRLGGEEDDHGITIIEAEDNTFLIGGWAKSNTIDNKKQAWLIKTDSEGNIFWDKTLKRYNESAIYSMKKSLEDGYILIGYAKDEDEKPDIYIIKIDARGNIFWDKKFGGPEEDIGYDIIVTSDKSYLIVGYTKSMGEGEADGWVLKTDHKGNLLWEKAIGGSEWDEIKSVIENQEQDYVMTGNTINYQLVPQTKDVWLLKMDQVGNILWDKTFARHQQEEGNAVIQTISNDYFIIANTESKTMPEKRCVGN